jgi:O-antigen/teichoic acid export membrane protein
MATVHANTPKDALVRMENLVGLSGVSLSPQAVRSQMASALHLVVQTARMRDGRRRITHIDEVFVNSEGALTTRTLFGFKPGAMDEHGNFVDPHKIMALSLKYLVEKRGWSGAVVGKIIGLACGIALAWFWIARHFPESALTYFKFSHLAELFSFGIRYVANGMAIVVIILTNRLMLANMVDVESSSLFAVASLFPQVLMIVIQGYILGWQPWCFKRLARRQASDKIELIAGAGLYFAALPIGGLILAFMSMWLGPYVISADFSRAFDYILPLCLAMVMQGYYLFAQTILQFYQRLGALSAIACLTVLANIIFNYALIGSMGTLGSCWATVLAYAIGFVITAAIAAVHLYRYNLALKKETSGVRQ